MLIFVSCLNIDYNRTLNARTCNGLPYLTLTNLYESITYILTK